MSEEDQKQFQDELELDRYIEQLRLQRSAHPPANLTSQQMRIYSMALLFHTASPRVADPRPEFGTQLYQHLLQQAQAEDKRQTNVGAGLAPANTPTVSSQRKGQFRSIYKHNQGSQPAQIPSTQPKSTPVKKHKMQDVWKGLVLLPRRTLLTGGAIAASLLAGAGIGAGLEHTFEQQSIPPQDYSSLPGNTWYNVTSVNELGQGPIAFTTETITGYVIRQPDNTGSERIIAFSGACPHLGCIVQWQNNQRQFLCPCHERTFDTAGGPIYPQNSQPQYTSLPRLETKIDNGYIYINVP